MSNDDMKIKAHNRLGKPVILVNRMTGMPALRGETVKYGTVIVTLAKAEYGSQSAAATGFVDTDKGTFMPGTLGLEWRLA